MAGGMAAWEGLVAEGPPEAGMAWFPESAGADKLIALAWLLEDGSRMFYADLSGTAEEINARELFGELAGAEEHHASTLAALYEKITGRATGPGFPHEALEEETREQRMEGGVSVPETLAWARGRKLAEVLELAMSLETNSLDLYIKMERAVDDKNSKSVFRALTEEEKAHLGRLTRAFEERT